MEQLTVRLPEYFMLASIMLASTLCEAYPKAYHNLQDK